MRANGYMLTGLAQPQNSSSLMWGSIKLTRLYRKLFCGAAEPRHKTIQTSETLFPIKFTFYLFKETGQGIDHVDF